MSSKPLNYRQRQSIRTCYILRRRRMVSRIFEAWRMYSRLSAFYAEQCKILVERVQELMKRNALSLWMKVMCNTEYKRISHIIYSKACTRIKFQVFSAWVRAFQENRRLNMENTKIAFEAIVDLWRRRRNLRFLSRTVAAQCFRTRLIRFGMTNFRERHILYYLTHLRGVEAHVQMARIACHKVFMSWRLRVWYSKKGTSHLCSHFMNMLPISLIEMQWIEAMGHTHYKRIFPYSLANANDTTQDFGAHASLYHGIEEQVQESRECFENLLMCTRMKYVNLRSMNTGGRDTSNVFKILAFPGRKRLGGSMIIVSRILMCHRLVKWWRVYTQERHLKRKERQKHRVLTAWRKETIRYRHQFHNVLKHCEKYGYLYRLLFLIISNH